MITDVRKAIEIAMKDPSVKEEISGKDTRWGKCGHWGLMSQETLLLPSTWASGISLASILLWSLMLNKERF